MNSTLLRPCGGKALLLMFVASLLSFCSESQVVTVAVPGTSNPWLAGMPNGTVTPSGYDSVPAESPVLVPATPGSIFTFSTTGSAYNFPCCGGFGAEGDTTAINHCAAAPENGIADVTTPLMALLGVFLNDNNPSEFSAPDALNFSAQKDRDFLTIVPALRQPFFIGDGLTSGGSIQQFIAPFGATRLFLGTLDSVDWADNSGVFNVTVSQTQPTFPYFWRQPRNQVGYWGKSVTFDATAVGALPLSYHWQKDGAFLGATNSSLTLTNLQISDGGVYSLVVTNVYGSITSNPALLTMNPSGVSVASYTGITIDGVVGLTYGIQSTPDLSKTNSWQGVANVTLSSPQQLWFDVQPENQPRRFYRVVTGPIPVP